MFSLHFNALNWAFFKSVTRPRDDLMRVFCFLEGFPGVFASVFESFLLYCSCYSLFTKRVLSCSAIFKTREVGGGKLLMRKLGGWMARQRDASRCPDDIPLTKLSLCISMIQ